MKYVFIVVGILGVALVGVLLMSDSGTPAPPTSQTVSPEDMRGVHIMPNGDVMSGSGMVIPNAEIQADGTIRMPGGQIVTPMADYRTP